MWVQQRIFHLSLSRRWSVQSYVLNRKNREVSSLAQHAIPPCPSRESYHHGRNDASSWTPPLTKIVATIGPTSEQFPKLQQVVRAGMRIMRLNFSHATDEEVELRVSNLRKCEGRAHAATTLSESLAEVENKNLRGILLDTKGPEIRTGKLRGDTSGKETISLSVGDSITLQTNPHYAQVGSTLVREFHLIEYSYSCMKSI